MTRLSVEPTQKPAILPFFWMAFGGTLAASSLHWLLTPARHSPVPIWGTALIGVAAAAGLAAFAYGYRHQRMAQVD